MNLIILITLIILIIFVLTILFCLYFCYIDNFENTAYNEDNYNLYTNKDHYRIGDILKGYYNNKYSSNEPLSKFVSLKDGTLKYHKNTLASEYLIQNTKEINENYVLLNKIINKKYKQSFNNQCCIVHLRVGDILDLPYYQTTKKKLDMRFYYDIPNEETKNHKPNLFNKWADQINWNNTHYIKPKYYYINKIKLLKQHKIKNILIIAGSHIDCGNYPLSTYFINLIYNLFKANHFNVKLRLANHPDKDIFLVSRAQYFIPSSGGYSKLLENISKLNNKTVI